VSPLGGKRKKERGVSHCKKMISAFYLFLSSAYAEKKAPRRKGDRTRRKKEFTEQLCYLVPSLFTILRRKKRDFKEGKEEVTIGQEGEGRKDQGPLKMP